jgi:GGDEF domain-containing protein
METTNTRVTDAPAEAPERERVYLMTIGGAQIGAVHKISGARAVVGRAPTAQIRVVDDGISREHAEIVVEGERVIVRDLASTNGTFVNGARTTSSEVRAGDQVSVGGATFVVFRHTDGLERARATGAAGGAAAAGTIQREAFVGRVAEEISYARRHGESVAVLAWDFADADALAARLGPGAFRALVDSARAASSAVLRPGDLLSAIGGGRLAALLRRTSVSEGAELARALATAVSRAAGDAGAQATARIGVAGPAAGGKPLAAATSALRAAESALADAHARGALVVASS